MELRGINFGCNNKLIHNNKSQNLNFKGNSEKIGDSVSFSSNGKNEKTNKEFIDYLKSATYQELDPKIVKKYVKNGTRVNEAKDEFGRTPIHLARSKEVAKILVDNNADVNAKDDKGKNALSNTILWQNEELMKFLIDNGADVNNKDNNQETPLFDAVRLGKRGLIELLLQNGADPNAKNKDEQTALHKAAIWGDIEPAAILMENGADINARDKNEKNPIQTALKCDNLEMAKDMRMIHKLLNSLK